MSNGGPDTNAAYYDALFHIDTSSLRRPSKHSVKPPRWPHANASDYIMTPPAIFTLVDKKRWRQRFFGVGFTGATGNPRAKTRGFTHETQPGFDFQTF